MVLFDSSSSVFFSLGCILETDNVIKVYSAKHQLNILLLLLKIVIELSLNDSWLTIILKQYH